MDFLASDWPIFGIFEIIRVVLKTEGWVEGGHQSGEDDFCKKRGFPNHVSDFSDDINHWYLSGNWTSKPPQLTKEQLQQPDLCPLALVSHYFAKAYSYLVQHMTYSSRHEHMLSQAKYKKLGKFVAMGEFHLVRFAGLPMQGRKAYDGTACAKGRAYMYHAITSRYPIFSFLHGIQTRLRQLYNLSPQQCDYQKIDANLAGWRNVI